MKFVLIFDEVFKHDINKLNRIDKQRVLKKVFELENFPELGKHLIGIDLWSLRVGKFRVIYKIENDKLLILILGLGHRKDVYRELGKFKK